MCNYILTLFIKLDDSQFNYSDYFVEGNGAITWFHPSSAEFENPLNITTPNNYKPSNDGIKEGRPTTLLLCQ